MNITQGKILRFNDFHYFDTNDYNAPKTFEMKRWTDRALEHCWLFFEQTTG